ncbi:MAG TPA: inositol monophosphatase family protein [Mariprofundaceae bacterium]|nr:inositol monophosphatase family protein [Mariprofundaceae bacterium]
MTFNAGALAGILERAGRDIIMPAFRSVSRTARKSDGSIVTTTDLACQTFVSEELYRLAPDIAFLSEEMREADQLHCLKNSNGRYWCLDPLDGTTNFVANIPVFGSSLALIVDGFPVLACIHDPVRQETFVAETGLGAQLNGETIRGSQVDSLDEAVGYIDFKRLSADQSAMLATRKLYRSQRNIGSCALEWAWLAAGRGDFIIHGGEKIWDFAAGSLLATEAGCKVGDFSSRPVFPANRLTSPILATATETLQSKLCSILEG